MTILEKLLTIPSCTAQSMLAMLGNIHKHVKRININIKIKDMHKHQNIRISTKKILDIGLMYIHTLINIKFIAITWTLHSYFLFFVFFTGALPHNPLQILCRRLLDREKTWQRTTLRQTYETTHDCHITHT